MVVLVEDLIEHVLISRVYIWRTSINKGRFRLRLTMRPNPHVDQLDRSFEFAGFIELSTTAVIE